MSIKRRVKRAWEWGEHLDFGTRVVDFIVDWRTLSSMVLALLSPILTNAEHRPWSEIIIIGLAVLVLLLAVLWGVAIAWRWYREGPAKTPHSLSATTPGPTGVPLGDTTVKWAFDHLCRAASLNAAMGDTVLIWRELRQAARDGRISVWGRPQSAALSASQFVKPVQMVPLVHWRDYDFDELRCLVGDDDTSFARTRPDNERTNSIANGYADLRLNKLQIKELSKGQVVEKRSPILQLRSHAIDQGWPPNFTDPRWLTFLSLLRQAASDGTIKLWGRDEKKNAPPRYGQHLMIEPLLPIPLEHWSEFQIEPNSFLNPDRADSPRTYAMDKKDWGHGGRYSDLHIEAEKMGQWLATVEVPIL